MSEQDVDKKLEGRLFELLEVQGKVRLGVLVQLRRRSRQRGITLLHAAIEAGEIDAGPATLIAEAAGLKRPTAPPPNQQTDEFDALPKIDVAAPNSDDDILSESLLDELTPSVDEMKVSEFEHTTQRLDFGAALAQLDVPAKSPPPLPPPSANAPPSPPPLPTLRPPGGRPPVARPSMAGAGLDNRITQTVPNGPAFKRPSAPDVPPFTPPLDTAGRPTVDMSSGPGHRIGSPPTEPEIPAFIRQPETLINPHLDLDETPVAGPPTLMTSHNHDMVTMQPGRSEWGDTAPPDGDDGSSAEMLANQVVGSLPSAGERYSVGRELGRGGMGQVIAAQDIALKRPVALKLLLDQDDPSLRVRFVDEARVTGQLQHPSIPPVYELGQLNDGRLFFAMKRIEGRTLREILEDLRAGDADVERQFGRVRLLRLFVQICRAIAYAHNRGVMHRDLKPDNVMLGDFGEVTVMDWGLAKPFGAKERPAPILAPGRESGGRFSTQLGEITGTPQYMPPEQAAGRVDELGAHTDIYSLGACLYELLTLEPPFDGTSVRAIREAVLNGRLRPPSEVNPNRLIPHDLEQLTLHCLSRDPSTRPRSAAWIADQIDAFLEGEQERSRKAAERIRLLHAGEKAAETYYLRYEQHRQLRNKTAILRARLDPWAQISERQRIWQEEDAEEKARLEAARALSGALAAYHAALGVDGEHEATRSALRELYFSAFLAAELDGDAVQMAHYENLVRAFDDDQTYSARLKGDGSLEVSQLPRGVTARLFKQQSVDRVVRRTDPQVITTPCIVEPLPMGSYVLELEAPGLKSTRVPIFINRQERQRCRLRLFPDSVVGPGLAHITGGPALFGGDPLAQLARPPHTEEVDDFFIAIRPVTSGEYLQFIHDVARNQGSKAAVARAPRSAPSGPSLWTADHNGMPTMPERDAQGLVWHPQWPVVNVSHQDALAYCAWLSQTSGDEYRLPTDLEWEKAARGADGRLFPWGDAWEPIFCHMGLSRNGAPARGPIGGFEVDVSVYGVIDLAGGVSEWTQTQLDRTGLHRITKGGNWASGPTECRAASRFTQIAEQVLPTLGFRVARNAPG